MAVPHPPDGDQAVIPYLIVRGADRLIAFLKEAFDAEELLRVPRPAPEGGIMHAQLRLFGSAVELADATDRYPAMPAAIHLYVPDVDLAFDRALKAGGLAHQPPIDHDYGERGADVEDPAGNRWFLATRTA